MPNLTERYFIFAIIFMFSKDIFLPVFSFPFIPVKTDIIIITTTTMQMTILSHLWE